jgi:regulator of sirC expression with transglutaminase-like and TPR domain
VKELQRAIESKDIFLAALSLAKIFQPNEVNEHLYLLTVQKWALQAQDHLVSSARNSAVFQRFIRFFYVELAFSGDEREYFSTQHNLLNHVIDYRTGIPVTLSIVFQALAKNVGFNVSGINFPGHFLIKCQFDKEPTIYLDPLNGRLLNRQDIEKLYFAILHEIEDEKMPEEALDKASCSETIISLLHNLKVSFINGKSYSEALQTVELLVNLCPNDPYERRDRGFLLHQLDCTQVAIADYQYFIRQRPEDPSSQLLQAQLQQLTAKIPQVLH